MNDRPQAGTAGLTQEGTIEIIQNRRLLDDDAMGNTDYLNETESDGLGLRVNAVYNLQVFDLNSTQAQSAQRKLQISK